MSHAPATPPLRLLDPFCFFAGAASAIGGVGGEEAPSDSRYCFHTQYLEMPPGRARYHAKFMHARATYGELQLRVHGFYPGFDAQLVASTVSYLDDLDQEELILDVNFVALEGIQYALCGYVANNTDMQVSDLNVWLDEPSPVDARSGRRMRASLIGHSATIEDAPKIQNWGPLSAATPVSQPFTFGQVASPYYAALWPQIPQADAAGRIRWSQVAPLQALTAANMLQPGAQVRLLSPPSPAIEVALNALGCLVQQGMPAEEPLDGDETAPGLGADAVIFYTDASLSPEAAVETTIDLLALGGMGLIVLSVGGEVSCNEWQNSMRRLAIRVIGLGHQMVQFNFSAADDWWPEAGEQELFLFILRK